MSNSQRVSSFSSRARLSLTNTPDSQSDLLTAGPVRNGSRFTTGNQAC
jgi:hypothetical protein